MSAGNRISLQRDSTTAAIGACATGLGTVLGGTDRGGCVLPALVRFNSHRGTSQAQSTKTFAENLQALLVEVGRGESKTRLHLLMANTLSSLIHSFIPAFIQEAFTEGSPQLLGDVRIIHDMVPGLVPSNNAGSVGNRKLQNYLP